YYEPQIAVSRYGWIVNVNESATLRSLPSTDSAAYAYIPKGTMVTDIAYINNKFYKVIYNGVKGYVLKDLVLVDYNW
ncbi:MAG: SH3 domain-containing protein, partial [Oribacterium sp.]|nr:SH3 domain-containing protein [Oribacterium sp.]